MAPLYTFFLCLSRRCLTLFTTIKHTRCAHMNNTAFANMSVNTRKAKHTRAVLT